MDNQELIEKISEIRSRWMKGESLTNADYELFIQEARRACAFLGHDPIYFLTCQDILRIANDMERFLTERVRSNVDITRDGFVINVNVVESQTNVFF